MPNVLIYKIVLIVINYFDIDKTCQTTLIIDFKYLRHFLSAMLWRCSWVIFKKTQGFKNDLIVEDVITLSYCFFALLY